MRKIFRFFLIFFLPLLAILVVVILVALPGALKRYINQHGIEYTGRRVSVEKINVQYLNTTLVVGAFALYEPDGKTPFLAFDSLELKVSLLPLAKSRLDIEKFRVVHPQLTIIRKDTTFNFDDIPRFLASRPAASEAKDASAPIEYHLKNLAMERGELLFRDLNVGQLTTLRDLKFTIPQLVFNQEEVKNAGIRFHLENGGSVEATTSFNRKEGSFLAGIQLDKLDISPFLPYAKSYVHLSGLAGMVGGNFTVKGSLTQLDSLCVSGKGVLTDFSCTDDAGRKVIGSKSATVEMDKSYPICFSYRFNQIGLTEPYLFAEVKDSTLNLLNLMVASPADTVPFSYFYCINKLNIENGLLNLRDNSCGEPFDYSLSELAMNADSICSESKWVKTFATMRLNKRGKLQAELGFNPADPFEMKINYVIQNFQLSDLNLYARYWTGYPVITGNMYYKGNTLIHNKQLTSENKLIIRDAKIGKKSGGLMNLPLRLALYLLKDIHGDIILDLPLSGDLNNPQIKIGRLVWQTLKNLVVKVVASPFLSLSKLIGVDPEELKGVEFNYADTTLTATHLRRIRNFTELEKKKPDMKAELNYYNDNALERKDIARSEAVKLLLQSDKDSKADDATLMTFLKTRLAMDTISMEDGCLKLAGMQRVDSLQQLFSARRIALLEAAIHKQDSTSNIRVVIPDKASPENVGSRPVFVIKYKMEE